MASRESEKECLNAAKAGDLQFLQSRGHELDGCLRKEISLCAARGGHLEVLHWLSLQHTALNPRLCTEAAAGGHLDVLQWAQGQGCHLDEDTCAAAARNGHVAVLRWARRHGCPWSAHTCQWAALKGHLAVLQYARQNGCEWGPTVCSAAAQGGHLITLKWLRQHGCSWDCWTNAEAALNGHLEVLKWARQQQCPWWPHDRTQTLEGRNIAPGVLVFLRQQQAPLSASHLAQARAVAIEMTCAVLALRAALPDRTPHEVVLIILSLLFSDAEHTFKGL